jgi:polar amino acid transport system substrate-binding protein
MKGITSLFALFALLCSAPSASAVELKTAAQETSPKFVKTGNTMGGIAVDVMRALEKLDPTIRFVGEQTILPMKRREYGLTEEAANSDSRLDCFFGLAKDAERAKKFTYSKVPIYSIKNVMAVRADDSVKVSSFDDIKKLKDNVILANNGYAQAKELKAVGGLNIDDGGATHEDNFAKLVQGRGRFFFSADITMRYTLKSLPARDNVKILPAVFSEMGQYLVYSHSVPKEISDRIDANLQKLIDSGEIAKILAKYTN